jgi:uncharacterized protein (TIGR03435 family)
MRALLWSLLLLSPTALVAQETPKFDAIVARRHDPSDPSQDGGIYWKGLTFEAKNVPMTFLVTRAFGTEKWLIEGMPAWASKGTWDFSAKVTPDGLAAMKNVSHNQMGPLLKMVLTEQFGLRYHFEDKVQPVYELTVLPGGPKFKPTPPPDGDASKRRPGNWNFFEGTANAKGITMPQFAESFSPLVERVIVDKTGLTDMYDLEVKWTPDDVPTTEADTTPGVFTALREQLGLKLTPAKASVPSLVIDAMTPPDDN